MAKKRVKKAPARKVTIVKRPAAHSRTTTQTRLNSHMHSSSSSHSHGHSQAHATSLSKKDESRLFAFLATFLSIIGFVIALVAKRNDEYVMYYARTSLVVFFVGCIAGGLSVIVDGIPIIGSIISGALTLLIIFVWVVSWMFSLSGEKKYIALISDWADKVHFM